MSKFAIFLFTVLLAAGSKADSQRGYIEVIKDNALFEINATISRIQEEVRISENIIAKESEFFVDIRREMLMNNSMEASAKEERIRQSIGHIGSLFVGIDICNCVRSVEFMYQRIRNARSITEDCIMNNIDDANVCIEMIDVKSLEAFAKLSEMRQKIEQASDIIGGEANIEKIGKSVTEIGREANQLTDSVKSDLKIKISEFKLKLDNIKSKLNDCSFQKALKEFSMEWAAIVRKMSVCIANKIHRKLNPVVLGI